MGSTYAKYRGTYTYVKLVKSNGDTYFLEDIDLADYHVGQIMSFYVTTKPK